MKNKVKIAIIACVVILIAVIVAMVLISVNKKDSEDNIDENKVYIDMWRDNAGDTDISLYSSGSGDNEMLYLGSQPIHYLVYDNGEVHTKQESSYKNKKTGKRDPATIEYVTTLSESDLQSLENELKSIIENDEGDAFDFDATYWYIRLNGELTRVKGNLLNDVLNNYI